MTATQVRLDFTPLFPHALHIIAVTASRLSLLHGSLSKHLVPQSSDTLKVNAACNNGRIIMKHLQKHFSQHSHSPQPALIHDPEDLCDRPIKTKCDFLAHSLRDSADHWLIRFSVLINLPILRSLPMTPTAFIRINLP